MTLHILSFCRYTPPLILLLSLQGCASHFQEQRANKLLQQGHAVEAMRLWQTLSEQHPQSHRLKYIHTRDEVLSKLLNEAYKAQRQQQTDEALNRYNTILSIDPQHAAALRGVELIYREQRHQQLLKEAEQALADGQTEEALRALNTILSENPQHVAAKQHKQQLDLQQQRQWLHEPLLKQSLRKPVSLEFKNASLQAILDVLAQSAGINFLFDKEVKADLKTTIYARHTSIEDALNLILKTNQLNKKVLNDSTLLIYPDNPEKTKQYEELVVRSFYLGAADPKKMQDMLRIMVNPKAMYIDDKLRLLVIRDSLEIISTVEKLIATYDIPEPEVNLDVEVLEVSSDSLLNLGIQYPNQISASVSGAAKKAGQLTIDELKDLNRDNFSLTVPDPIASVNFKQTSGSANILANPKIRVRNREKAKILIGDKVPVVTTTSNQTSSSISESVSYLDVGLKLEVEPEVHVNQDVSINVALEVSSIVKEVKSSTGLLTYQIGTRNANTVLRLKDGETQMLAGLIKDEQRESASHFPGLGKLPLLGKLFSNDSNSNTKSEIILLITPHVVRPLNTPSIDGLEFASGTGAEVSTKPLRLTSGGQYNPRSNKGLGAAKNANVSNTLNKVDTPTPTANAPIPAVTTTETSATPNSSAITAPESGVDSSEIPLSLGNDSVLQGQQAALQLDIVAPAQIPVNKEFTVALMSQGVAFDKWSFDIETAYQGLEIINANLVAPSSTFNYRPTNTGIHVDLGATPNHSGPLIMLTLKATQLSDTPLVFRLSQSQAVNSQQQKLLTTGEPRSLMITP
ncbi:secretin and TonB N-terminal domain-containing protein [Agitococcus lubricus]|uniref:General secretion pathway protein D n=1 Tax=Agitococcus lubricus TaxID=1077255 RepID=A0A2T5J230_9GAMM|nr:secretin and TonB N-terminal domain-containing protein [Agitococcus lubricus]PTQ90497.1 general secretion pathway protein D [Agitococcus lubricus]